MTRRDALRALAAGLLCGTSRGASDVPAAMDRGVHSVEVKDEFGTLRTAIVHDASNAEDLDWDALGEWQELAESRGQVHPEAGPIVAEKLVREVARFRALLTDFGVELLTPEAIDGAPAQLFTRDPLFAVGRSLFQANLLDEHRSLEHEALEPLLRPFGKPVVFEADGASIEGGDVFVLNEGRDVLVGTNVNTNAAGARALAEALKDTGVRVHPIPHHRLHLDCCLAPLPSGAALVHRRGISRHAVPTLKKLFRELIPLDSDEASRSLAANLLWLDRDNVVSKQRVPRTNARLRKMGYKVHALDFTNVTRMWGSFRCATCPIRRD